MHLTFLSFQGAFDFRHIGGVDSIVRRIALQLALQGDCVDLVHYGATLQKSVQLQDRIAAYYFTTLEDACAHICRSSSEHVVSVYLKPRDRFFYSRVRRANAGRLRFHHVLTVWPESRLKRELLFGEARLFPFNGRLFCVSPRIHRSVSRWFPRAAVLLPPVPVSYFCTVQDKCDAKKIRLAYAGRVDAGKGCSTAVDILSHFAGRSDHTVSVYGFAWSHKPETIRLHEMLLSRPDIQYFPARHEGWTPEAEDMLRQQLHTTDILLLPYIRLSSTVDTPLLLLEGMASLCAIVTPPLGDLQTLYGSSMFNLQVGWDREAVIRLIDYAAGHIAQERARLVQRRAELHFDTPSITRTFKESIV